MQNKMTKADELYYNKIDLNTAKDEYEKELRLLSQSEITEEVSIRMLQICINLNVICKKQKRKYIFSFSQLLTMVEDEIKNYPNSVELKMIKGDIYLYFGSNDNLYQATRIYHSLLRSSSTPLKARLYLRLFYSTSSKKFLDLAYKCDSKNIFVAYLNKDYDFCISQTKYPYYYYKGIEKKLFELRKKHHTEQEIDELEEKSKSILEIYDKTKIYNSFSVLYRGKDREKEEYYNTIVEQGVQELWS